MFRRKKKTTVVGYQTVFEEGGKVYVYKKTPDEMAIELNERYLLRGELPFSVVEVHSNGEKISIVENHQQI